MFRANCLFAALVVASIFSASFAPQVKAQMVPPVFPDQCGYREARCFRDRNGNMIDKRTGNVYNRRGRLIRYGNGPTTPTSNTSSSGSYGNGSASQLTPEQIRQLANAFNQAPPPLNQVRSAICEGKTVPSVQGRPLSASEMFLLKNELGCRES
jgi:hypothetical protein